MDNSTEEIKDKILNEEIRDTEVFSFGYLVNVILDYYHATSASADPSESWKKGTGHDGDDNTKVPGDIDEMIKKAFKTQLKKFNK